MVSIAYGMGCRILSFLLFVILFKLAKSQLRIPPTSTCACPSEILTYTCTANGIGSTVWRGSLFDCPNNEIRLLHSQFSSNSAFGTCNSGAVLGQSVGVENDHFTSELLVTVSRDFNNKTVRCIHDAASGDIVVGTSVISIVEASYPPPDGVHLVSVNNGTLVFGWNPVNLLCTSVHYNISSDCGYCRGHSDSATASCSNLQLSSTPTTCTFAITSVVCGSIFGIPSDTVEVTLKVPGVPVLDVIPIYSSDDGSLTKLAAIIQEMEPFILSGDVSVAVTNYKILYNDLSFDLSSCGDNNCEMIEGVSPSSCSSVTNISVRASASNMLGEGPQTNPMIIECTNRFVSVQYNSATSTLSCKYLNTETTTGQSCSIKYWLCQQGRMESVQSYNLSNGAKLKLTASGTYCYLITAVYSDLYTIRIEGSVEVKGTIDLLIPVVSAVTVVATIVAGIIIAAVSVCIFRRIHKRKKESAPESDELNEINQPLVHTTTPLEESPLSEVNTYEGKELKLKELDQDRFIIGYRVENDCQLKPFINSLGLAYKKGCVYYEFTHEETISKDKEIIFMPKGKRQYYSSVLDWEELRDKFSLYGEKVTPNAPSLKEYTVFVQSKGLGTRHLSEGSYLLYELPQPAYITQKEVEIIDVNHSRTIEELCHGENVKNLGVFVEVDGSPKSDQELKSDVIFMNEKTQKCFTSPFAGHVIDKGADVGIHWKVFMRFHGSQLQGGSKALLVHMRIFKGLNVSLIPIDSANIETRCLSKYSTLRNLHEHHGPCVLLNKRHVTLTEKTPVLNVILINNDMKDRYFTVPSSLNILEQFKKVEEPWSVFILCLFREDMKVDARNKIIFQVTKKKLNDHTVGEWPVCIGSEHFSVEAVTEDCTVENFCRGKEFGIPSVFFDSTNLRIHEDNIEDGYLWNEVTKEVYTGPSVRHMIKEYSDNPKDGIWKLFIRPKKVARSIKLIRGTSVLISNPSYENEKYCVFVVADSDSEDNMRMSDFIEKRLNSGDQRGKQAIHFIRGKAFYEFTKEEDLRFYRDIVYATEAQLKEGLLQKLKSGVHLYYDVPDRYSENAKPPTPGKDERVFIQSTSHGSMCVESGMVVLYKVSDNQITVDQHKGTQFDYK